jgi:hypothetical protein
VRLTRTLTAAVRLATGFLVLQGAEFAKYDLGVALEDIRDCRGGGAGTLMLSFGEHAPRAVTHQHELAQVARRRLVYGSAAEAIGLGP